MNTTHETLAKAWAIYQGLKGTQKQIEKIMKQLRPETLQSMLAQRNIFFN